MWGGRGMGDRGGEGGTAGRAGMAGGYLRCCTAGWGSGGAGPRARTVLGAFAGTVLGVWEVLG